MPSLRDVARSLAAQTRVGGTKEPGKGRGGSFVDRIVEKIAPPLPPPPPAPKPPAVDQRALERSVNRKRVNQLTVQDVGLIVFNETQSFSDRLGSNENLDTAREKIAHVAINRDIKRGGWKGMAEPIEPSAEALRNPAVRKAYNSSVAAAERAYLNLVDPTQGAGHFNIRTDAGRSNLRFEGGTREGVRIRTQSGPYNNSFLGGDVPSRTAWLNTYEDDR